MFIDKNGVVRKPKAYLAGYKMFFPDADERAESDKKICDKYGIIGVYPPDEEPDDEFAKYVPKDDSQEEILRGYFMRDVNNMQRCDMVLAQLEDFRGTEPDSGTAFECGYMAGKGKRLYAYCGDTSPLLERVKIKKHKNAEGLWCDEDENRIEDFGYPLNLMFCGCMKVYDTFENMVIGARADFDAELTAAGLEPYFAKN
ncbi:MAG: nucleoside 2-deoxyribosyltransferase [Oscillospiraceae bacterium]